MSDVIYAILPRPPLSAGRLVFRRRVSKPQAEPHQSAVDETSADKDLVERNGAAFATMPHQKRSIDEVV